MEDDISKYFKQLEEAEKALKVKGHTTPKSQANLEMEANRPNPMPEYVKKWWDDMKKHRPKRRFLTSYDMAEAKHMEAINNSKVKRGEIPAKHTHIIVCGCGAEGCFGFRTYNPEDDWWNKKK